MRMAIGIGAALALMLAAAPASAWFKRDLNAPWCLAYSGGHGLVECAFYSFEQCMATRSGLGGDCQPNFTARYVERPHRSKRQRRSR